MFNFKKKTELISANYYTLHWRAEERFVYFKEFLNMIEENGLKIVDLRIKNVKNFEGIEFLFLSFGLEGTFSQLKIFDDLCLVDRRMNYFRKLGEGF